MATARRRRWRSRWSRVAALALGVGERGVSALSAASSAPGAGGSALEADGATTYCWKPGAGDRDGSAAAAAGTCPVALGMSIALTATAEGVEVVEVALAAAVTDAEALAASCGLAAADGGDVAAGIYLADAADLAATTSALATVKNATLAGGAGTATAAELLRTVVAKTPRSLNSTFVGRVTCSGEGYVFAVYGELDRSAAALVMGSSVGDASPAVELSGVEALGSVGSQLAILAGVVVLVAAAVAAVFCLRRRRSRAQTKGQRGLTSPTTGGANTRLSDWSEVYATNESLPASILVDDCTTLAILRASVVSPTRRVADFTRDVAVWDDRPSASPITPGSCILASAGGNSLSPGSSFVLMESSSRASLPLHEALQSPSDSEDERLEVDV